MGMVTSEHIGIDENGRTTNCSPLSYKIPNVRSIPRKFNVTLLKYHDLVTTVYSSKGVGEPPFLRSTARIFQTGLTGNRPKNPSRLRRANNELKY